MNASPFWIMLLLSSGADERRMIDRAFAQKWATGWERHGFLASELNNAPRVAAGRLPQRLSTGTLAPPRRVRPLRLGSALHRSFQRVSDFDRDGDADISLHYDTGATYASSTTKEGAATIISGQADAKLKPVWRGKRIEHQTTNLGVGGSNPSGRAKSINNNP